ncbi:TPA: hypothetical protein UMB92_000767 [Stenotrophomonas maltophilia]|uniref:hypothetical protein n=1 Tax=Stenotrophomonas maltophilia TaxID=40324 RepID=UPI0015DEE296|nr:hypothetical protein [Stenotrophomonas maltophilia]MBA0446806.1 hypothetical protein [Stenotrophomonas maltophilia]HEL2977947.1 hypothetical protein [Stenotrophomonas maltophilia]
MASIYNVGMDSVLQRMTGTGFFSRLGETLPATTGVVAVRSLAEALRTIDTEGFEWMPTTLGDPDPFHGALPRPAELADARRELNRTLMRALSALDLPALRCGAHDLHLVARNGAMFAFRQRLLETHLGLPAHWEPVLALYEHGHWPLAHAPGRLLVL